MKPYELRSYLDYAEDPDGCCTLAIHAEDPEALAGSGCRQAESRQSRPPHLYEAVAGLHDE